MPRDHLLVCLLVAALVVIGLLLVRSPSKNESYSDLRLKTLPTSPEVEYIQGYPDFEAVNAATGETMIEPGDLGLSPGIGSGEGTFGFGRFASSFTA